MLAQGETLGLTAETRKRFAKGVREMGGRFGPWGGASAKRLMGMLSPAYHDCLLSRVSLLALHGDDDLAATRFVLWDGKA